MIHESSNNFLDQVRFFWNRRAIVFTWSKFKIISSYAQTKLGLVWIFLQPVLTAAVYTVAFSYLLGARPPRDGVPFLAFYLTGTIAWQMFNESVMRSGTVIVSNLGLMTQIRFPREAAVYVDFTVRVVDFTASFLVTIFILALNGIYPNQNYLYLPIWIFIISFFSLGAMFILSFIGVIFRDLPQVLSPIMRFMFFMSGVIFSIETAPDSIQPILRLNPIVWVIEAFRAIMLHNESPELVPTIVLLAISFLFFVFGYWYFKLKESQFTDYI